MIKFKEDINTADILNKNLIEIIPSDILKYKDNYCFYELKNISYNKENIAYYHFYGFTIRGKENLKYYFENINSKFIIYKEK